MITPSQIEDQNISPALDEAQVINLLLLVKQYPVYARNLGLFPNLATKLEDERATPTENTRFLKAVLAALDDLPEVVVESQGRDTAPSHFTTNANWNALALDVLNLFYELPAGLLSQHSFALAKPKVEDLLIDDNMDTVLLSGFLKR